MKLRLGRFLLQGLHRKKRPSPPAFSSRKKASSRKQASRKVGLQKPGKDPSQEKKSPVAKVRAHELIALPRESGGPGWDESIVSGPLSTEELIRPDQGFLDSIQAFLLDQRSEHTRRAYGKDLKRFVKFLLKRRMERGVEKLDRSVVIAYKESLLSEGLEHTTIDRHLATLRSFFRWLVDDGKIAKSPVEGVRFLNPKRVSATQGFTDVEVRKLLSLPNLHTRTGSQHYAILMVLFYCGLRRSELCSLKTSSVGIEREQPFFRLKGKGNAERIVPLPPPVWKALEHYLKIARKDRSQDGYLFSPIRNNRTGELEKPLDPSMIFYVVTKYASQAGIANRVSPHSCRATAISNARDHHVPDRAIQEFAGWASPDMITRYDKRKTALEKSAAHAIKYGAEDRKIPDPYSED